MLLSTASIPRWSPIIRSLSMKDPRVTLKMPGLLLISDKQILDFVKGIDSHTVTVSLTAGSRTSLYCQNPSWDRTYQLLPEWCCSGEVCRYRMERQFQWKIHFRRQSIDWQREYVLKYCLEEYATSWGWKTQFFMPFTHANTMRLLHINTKEQSY